MLSKINFRETDAPDNVEAERNFASLLKFHRSRSVGQVTHFSEDTLKVQRGGEHDTSLDEQYSKITTNDILSNFNKITYFAKFCKYKKLNIYSLLTKYKFSMKTRSRK